MAYNSLNTIGSGYNETESDLLFLTLVIREMVETKDGRRNCFQIFRNPNCRNRYPKLLPNSEMVAEFRNGCRIPK